MNRFMRLALLMTLAVASHDTWAQTYSILDLGFFGEGLGINSRGDVVGYINLPEGGHHPFLYSDGKVIDLGTLGGDYAVATDVNDSGEVVGYSTLPGNPRSASGEVLRRAFLFSGGRMIDLGTLGGSTSVAFGINSSGQVVGWSELAGGIPHAFLYSGGSMTGLGSLSSATKINDAGQVIGSANGRHAFVYSGGLSTDLGFLPGYDDYSATDINASGQVVGWAKPPGGGPHGFVYSGGRMTELSSPASWTRTQPWSINRRGDIVGEAAIGVAPLVFLYSGGKMQDLNVLLRASEPRYWVQTAKAINDRGQIVGLGGEPSSNRPFAYRLTPVSTGITYVALGDSYSAGTGAFNYFPDQQGQCYRSKNAYSQVVPFPEDSKVVRDFFACNGAQTPDVLSETSFNSKKGEAPQITHPELGSADLVTISVGGNDVGFADVLAYCFKFPSDWCLSRFSEKPTEISVLRDTLANTYRQIKSKAPVGTPIYVLGYPRIFALDGHESGVGLCNDGRGRRLVFAGYEPRERDFINILAEQLNNVITLAAGDADVRYVPVIEAFAGHEICGSSGFEWLHSVRLWPLDMNESFHPTARGQQAYAAALKAKIAENGDFPPAKLSLLAASQALPSSSPVARFVATPLRSSAVQLQASASLSIGSFGTLVIESTSPAFCGKPGGPAVDGQSVRLLGSGFSPSSRIEIRYQAEIDTTDQHILDATAGVNGDLDVTVTLPSRRGFEGTAKFFAFGTESNGRGRLRVATFFQTSDPRRDTDGDGVPDVCDVCPNTYDPSQADRDGDGIGDACDPCPDDPDDPDGHCVNHSPVASAGLDRTVPATSIYGANIMLDGSASHDPDADALAFTWTGPFGTASGPKPTVAVPIGTSVITLTVSDGRGGSSTAAVRITVVAPLVGDVNGDGRVDCADLSIIKTSFGKRRGQAGFDSRADVNNDGVVDVKDLALVSQKVPSGTKCK